MHDDDVTAFDALIDRTARELTAGDPPAAIAEGVRTQIAGRRRAWPFAWWQPVSAVAVLMVVAALWRAWPIEPAVVSQKGPDLGVTQSGPTAVIGGSAPRDPPYISQSQVAQLPRSGPAGRVSRPDQVTALTTTDATPLPGIEPLELPPLEDELFALESSALTMPIEIEPLQIAPLQFE